MNELKKKIGDLLREHVDEMEKRPFVPGETPILTGFGVYDSGELSAIVDSLLDGWFGLGKRGREFEKQFSATIDRRHSSYVNSGSSANLLALTAVKNKRGLKGGEVITPACAFPTTLNPIIQLGFKPHFVDIDATLNLTPESVEAAINENTVGIMFAHTMGNPAKADEIVRIAEEKNLFVIEDCCDALGSVYNGKKCGSFGDASTFSLYPAHLITTGEGGIVATDDKEVNKIVVSLRDWGRDCWCTTDEKNPLGACRKRFDYKINGVQYDHKYIYSQIGYNLKPLELQAAMGLQQLEKIDHFVDIRKKNFELYKEEFATLGDFFSFPEVYAGSDPVFFGLPILIKDQKIDRQKLTLFLNDNKIATRYLFGGNIIHQPAYKNIEYALTGDLAKTEEIFQHLFWIGIHQGVTEEMVRYVGSKFKEYLRQYHN